jgi:dihydroorotase (multifunctional complex type)
MKVDTLITNAKIVMFNDIIDSSIAVSGGKIIAISKKLVIRDAEKIVDAGDNLVIPGAIDCHVHLEPYEEHPGGEDFTSGTAAAAVGGVTTIGLMPPSILLTENQESFQKNKTAYSDKSFIDYCMLGAFSGGENKDFSKFIPELWEQGAIALKGYMHNHRPDRWLKACYDGEMLWALEQIAKVGGIANVHCENESMQSWNREKLLEKGLTDADAYLKFSPPIVEYEAGKRFMYLCKEKGARGLMVHTSLPELVVEAEEEKRCGHKLYVETCPHYLYFTEDDLREKGAWFKCAPTLRDKNRVNKMWKMLDRGYLDTIASDHVPTPRSLIENAQKKGDLFTGAGGMPHVEHVVNAVLNGVNKGWANLFSVVEALTSKPAKIYGLYPKKGVIQVGSDADLIIVDMKKENKVTPENLITKAGWSSFEGMKLKGVPVLTMVRGEIIAQNQEIIEKPGYGKFVPRLSSSINQLKTGMS